MFAINRHRQFVRWATYWMVPVVVVTAGMALGHTPRAQAPTVDKAPGQQNPSKHGLTGAYYLSNLETHTDTKPWGNYFVQVWIDDNDFGLPRAFGPPAATRVDAQIAFGQGKGFSKAGDSSRTSWAPMEYTNLAGWNSNNKPDSIAAVIWKGYIHFPKAGTYYFATLSRNASAVYLNDARVTLNGKWAGGMPSDVFSYADVDIADYIQNVSYGRRDLAFGARPNETYIVPVPIDKPRDLPIEVQYQAWAHDHQGIDLFWVTPDSPKDSTGKPIAQIVPADVLYTDPPSTIESPVVRRANSTVSADFLYFPTESIEGWVTVKVRLADKNGKPVTGKQVYVSSVTSFGGPDTIVQPEKPTDENGVTTAKLRGNKDYSVTHESQIFATDVTDFVDSAQVAHVSFQTPPAYPFFPDAFSPYYDPNMPQVEPLPLQVGRQVTIKMPLVNRSKFAADLTTVFESSDANIGAIGWHEIGRVKNVRLQPGEHKDVGITWTPGTTSTHVCFRVSVNAKMVADAHPITRWLTAMLMPWSFRAEQSVNAPQHSQANGGSVSKNYGSVQLPPLPPNSYIGPPCFDPAFYNGHTVEGNGGRPCTPAQPWKNAAKRMADGYQQAMKALGCDPSNPFDEGERFGGTGKDCENLRNERKGAKRMSDDPPDPDYRRVAVADSDNAAAYLDAWRRSWERYQTAKAEGDQEWMAKHSTAIHLYVEKMIAALRSDADQLERHASQLPPEKPERSALLQIVSLNRQTADEAEHLDTSPTAPEIAGTRGMPLVQTYDVGNPHDKEETVQLVIRPISIPPDWKLSIVNAEQLETSGKQVGEPAAAPKYPVKPTMEPLHYSVTLPAKTEIKVASVVVPVGQIGANTTARWAVEGRIGNELLGGMVHEMNVPYIIADLKLPPVGSKEEDFEQASSGKFSGWRLWITVGGGVLAFLAILLIVFFMKRRRREQKPAV